MSQMFAIDQPRGGESQIWALVKAGMAYVPVFSVEVDPPINLDVFILPEYLSSILHWIHTMYIDIGVS